ncbi:MAG TPA: hypothetical protein ENN34_07865 [Deltaproteobacteria bacterium]|nr:hypothetical protein [Deltaproteobacteria bacterium]
MYWEVIIIGGGPAGISTALHLKRFSPERTRVLVLEKARYPRPKLCAGALVGDAEVLLRKLNLDVSEISHSDAEAAYFEYEGRGLTVNIPGSHILQCIQRDEFDFWLAMKARERGISISEGVNVHRVMTTETEVLVSTDHGDFRAQIVVGADGTNSLVRRQVICREPVCPSCAFEVLVTPMNGGCHSTRDAYFDFSSVPLGNAGYMWDFPALHEGKKMRCWGMYHSTVRTGMHPQVMKKLLKAELERCGIQIEKTEIRGHPIRVFSPFDRLSVPRIILVGDAAGVDPVFGEGISFGLGYGYLAARAIQNAFNKRDFSFRQYRVRVLCSPLGRALATRWFIAQTIYRMPYPWFQKLLWWVLKPVVLLVARVFVLNWAQRLK